MHAPIPQGNIICGEEIGEIIKNFQLKVIIQVFNVFYNMFLILPHFVSYVLPNIILLVDCNIIQPILKIVSQCV
jgi:hypothetical protein